MNQRNSYTSEVSLSHSRRYQPILFLLILAILLSASVLPNPARAQSSMDAWGPLVNISQSGAASQPRIVSAANGVLQVFWDDRFDGLMTSVMNTQRENPTWSVARSAALKGNPPGMPTILADADGWVHAFWQESFGPDGAYQALYHSQMRVGNSEWTLPERLAEDAILFSLSASPDGGLGLAFIRRIQAEDAPAGLFYRRLETATSSWSMPFPIATSVYYRMAAPGISTLALVDDGAGKLVAVWSDPLQGQLLSSASTNKGRTWSPAELFGDPLAAPTNPRLAAIPAATLAIWQSSSAGLCPLFQQQYLYPDAVPLQSSQVISPTQATASNWGASQAVLPNVESCPSGDIFWPQVEENRLVWLWGQGTSNLSLTAWTLAQNQWAEPVNFGFTFEDPQSSRLVVLSDLHATLSGNTLAVTGSDANGEIWATSTTQRFEDLVYAAPPPWSAAQQVSADGVQASNPALAMDSTGRAHSVWVSSADGSQIGASLSYSVWNPVSSASDQMLSSTTTIFPGSPTELARQPALFSDIAAEVLHLVWSGGTQGDILYSRAAAGRAGLASEWAPVQRLSDSPFATSPQIAQDGSGKLYAAYLVPINEERGVYLATSEDGGQTWSLPEIVFDGAAAGLQGLDHLALAADLEGNLHLAWVETTPSGSGTPQAIFYSSSSDQGETWSEPLVLAGADSDFPCLVITGEQLHLIYAQVSGSSGTLWERTLPLATLDGETAWSAAARIPGWQAISLPFGLAQDGDASSSALHLVGAGADGGAATYSAWQDGSWGAPEIVDLAGLRSAQNEAPYGVQAASRPAGGFLGVTWVRQEQSETGNASTLYFTARIVPAREVQPVQLSTPTPEPTESVQPTPLPPSPTPTVNLNLIPTPRASSSLPLIIGGFFGLLVVGGFLAWRFSTRARRK